MQFDVVLIAGPTASGKSRAALDLARTLGAHVVNADAMQIYRELRILTARPSGDERSPANPARARSTGSDGTLARFVAESCGQAGARRPEGQEIRSRGRTRNAARQHRSPLPRHARGGRAGRGRKAR